MTFVVSEMNEEQRAARLLALNKKLAARTDREGNALKGFEANVKLIRDEIDELEALK